MGVGESVVESVVTGIWYGRGGGNDLCTFVLLYFAVKYKMVLALFTRKKMGGGVILVLWYFTQKKSTKQSTKENP